MDIQRRRPIQHRRHAGQTLVIAIIILAVLLILGLAFAGVVSGNISGASRSAKRTVTEDLAHAGAEYAHSQMLNSALGADWRPDPTPPAMSGNFTRDPDAYYTRPGTYMQVTPDPARPTIQITDLGGPDYLGPYSKLSFSRGRALVRVRYAPSDYDAFAAPTGSLRQPGAARAYTIIESVGRSGQTTTDGRVDPSLLLGDSVQILGLPDAAALAAAVGKLKAADAQVTDSKKLTALASIGIVESAMFITNKDKQTRAAEIGAPSTLPGSPFWNNNTNVGVTYEGTDVRIPNALGEDFGATSMPGSTADWAQVPGLSSLYSNADVKFYGSTSFVLNRALDEKLLVAGKVTPGNDAASLSIKSFLYNKAADQFQLDAAGSMTLVGNAMSSDNPQFTTAKGALVDSNKGTDADGYIRSVPYKDPPLIDRLDPADNRNRYENLTRSNGRLNADGFNVGSWGYGRGVYIDSPERGNRQTEEDRENLDPSKALPNDWLNPNNANSRGWQGPYYIPVASYVLFTPDGFVITRDSRSRNKFWRYPETGGTTWTDPVNGQPRGNVSSVHYWTRYVAADNKTYIVNDVEAPNFNPNISDNAFKSWTVNGRAVAQEFNGVILAAGDVRTRGVIPTDVQVTLVTMGTAYIEGSLVRGVVGRDAATGNASTLGRPSHSALAILAKDYVTLNPTQFFAPAPGESPQAKSGEGVADTPNPVELDGTRSNLRLMAQFLLNPVSANPSNWLPYMRYYAEGGAAAGRPMVSRLLFSVAADDGGPSFASLDISTGTFADSSPSTGTYLWPARYNFMGSSGVYATEYFNDAGSFFTPPPPPAPPAPWNVPVLGLGDAGVNAYPKFMTVATPLYSPLNGSYFNAYSPLTRKLVSTGSNPEGLYALSMQDPTFFDLRLNPVGGGATKNWLVSRTAVAPFDVRVEACLYAQEGSFFVIPGNWFNTNPLDTRPRFESRVVALGGNTTTVNYGGGNALAQAQLERYQQYGNSPEVPFYGEPLDVRITIVGAISQNMPAPVSQQAEWLKKWGWIPRRFAATGTYSPQMHLGTVDPNVAASVAPNLKLIYDPMLATAGVPADAVSPALVPVRTDAAGRLLPPMPRLPVSPTLAFFGDVNP
ncbi:MAG: hypothetical protein KF857_07680 [Fimbriimonadaceae bacterium]|nr:hypothetical protein [Fimbriimonadaceae bacterium]